jgi:hypothetical protein
MKSLRVKLAVGVAVLGVAGVGTAAIAHDRSRFDEIRYTLSYRGPFDAGSNGVVTQAHIHLGARAVNGNIAAFLCSNLGNGPAGTPACPAEGTVSGTITPAQVIGPAAQGIAAGEFAELVRALRAGAAYANVHTTTFTAGEIRGQIGADDDDHHGRD